MLNAESDKLDDQILNSCNCPKSRLAPVDVLPNVNDAEVAKDAVADDDTAATILPYLDFLVIKSKLVPFVFNIVVNQPPSNNSMFAEPVPLIFIVPLVPLV